MEHRSRGDADYRFGYDDDELARLGEQHRVWAEENQRLLERAGFGAGATVVDLGCGPGFTTLDLAHVVGPRGRVIAVDRDGERSLPRLQQRAADAGLDNIELRATELEGFDLPRGSVDGVYGRWVLMYLPRPAAEALVRRAARWLRPGGACALAEICNFRHIQIHPACDQLPAVAEALMAAVAGGRGCDPEIGTVLPGLLASAGLDVELHVSTKVVRATTEGWTWPEALFRDHLPALVEEGYLSPEAHDAFTEQWRARSTDPEALFFSSPMLEVVGRR